MDRLDVGEFRRLLEESQDLHVDAMRDMQDPLEELVEHGRELRADGDYADAVRELDAVEAAHAKSLGIPVMAGLGVLGAAGLVVAGASPAFAARIDVQALQTAASLENLAVATYKKALTLEFLKGDSTAIKTVRAFAMITMKQHADHGKAFNARAKELGGRAQKKANPKYAPIVAGADLSTPLKVVELAIVLEDVATSTYVKNVSRIKDSRSRLLFGTVAGVESQHLATLYSVKALLESNNADLITVKATGRATDASKLPAAAGSAGVPETFKKTKLASPPREGAVK